MHEKYLQTTAQKSVAKRKKSLYIMAVGHF